MEYQLVKYLRYKKKITNCIVTN